MPQDRDDEVTQSLVDMITECHIDTHVMAHIDSEGNIRLSGSGSLASQRGMVEYARDMLRDRMLDISHDATDRFEE